MKRATDFLNDLVAEEFAPPRRRRKMQELTAVCDTCGHENKWREDEAPPTACAKCGRQASETWQALAKKR